MIKLDVQNLAEVRELEREAMHKIVGGIGFVYLGYRVAKVAIYTVEVNLEKARLQRNIDSYRASRRRGNMTPSRLRIRGG